MKRMALRSIVAGLALLVATAALAQEKVSPRVTKARSEARANAASPEGREWLKSHKNTVGAAIIPILNQCLADDGEELTAFSIYLRLTQGGRVREVLTELDESLGACMTTATKLLELPAPPREDYWVQVNLAADL